MPRIFFNAGFSGLVVAHQFISVGVIDETGEQAGVAGDHRHRRKVKVMGRIFFCGDVHGNFEHVIAAARDHV